MSTVDVTVDCPVFDSFRVQQVAGMFDVPLPERASQRFRVELPEGLDAEPWRVGLIVGPSGSGKSTVARAMFAGSVYRPREWPPDRAVVDGLGDRPIKEITGLFTAVGFSSPPSWVKPYQVLSNGEQFRCDLARRRARMCRPGCRPAGGPGEIVGVRRVHQRGGPQRGAGGVGGDRQGAAGRADRRAVRRRHLPLRRDRVARAGLGHRHGHLDVHAEVSSTTADRACDLSLPARCVAAVCAASLFERGAEPGRPLLPGPLGRQPGGVLRHACR